MERKEIQSIALAPAVATPFAAAWSEDNRISLITERGVHVVEVLPDFESIPQGFELRRTWIEPCDYFPTAKAGFDCDKMVWKMSQKDVYQMVLDTCLAPNLTMAKSAPPHIIQVAWSPAGMLKYGRCLLASVTNYGCVVVQAAWLKQWRILANISSLWSDQWTSEWESDEVRDKIDVLKERVEKLKATAITWSNIMDDGKKQFSYLLVGFQNGDIVVWRIDALPAIRKKDINPRIMLHFTTNLYRVTTLHWQHISEKAGCLFVGDVRGVIKLFSMSMIEDQLQCASSTEVWPHADRIQVSQLLTSLHDDNTVTVIAAKGSFVVAVALNADGMVVENCSHLVGNLAVTGLVMLKTQDILVLTHGGFIRLLHVVRSGKELRLEVQLLNSVKVPHSAYYGLAASPNRAIFCMVTSLCLLFDHLIQREPAQLTIFDQYELNDPYDVLLGNSLQSLQENWDYLELARLRGVPFRGLEILQNSDQLDNLSTCKLKVLSWLCKFAMIQDFTEEYYVKSVDLKDRITKIEQLIMNRALCSRATELLQRESLTSEEQQSLGLMLFWLRKVDTETTTNSPTKTAVKAVLCLAEKYPSLPERDWCSICGQDINRLEDPTEARCPSGHSLPRCCFSLLPCAEVPFWICQLCHTVAHASSGLKKAPVCPYCDRILYLDDNFLLPEEMPDIELIPEEEVVCKKLSEENNDVQDSGS
ncbi:general transcription factor 3C polypeptide 4 isoform X1 [Periplaneta americana]|uniref:general transcription factor 3C polypeptide 4 isoform X1 n=1 Tax=Periplaneta americana TaxID=6978 RepID=UPI0037E7FEC2